MCVAVFFNEERKLLIIGRYLEILCRVYTLYPSNHVYKLKVFFGSFYEKKK